MKSLSYNPNQAKKACVWRQPNSCFVCWSFRNRTTTLKPNGPAIKRTERKVPTCYVGIARGQPCEIARSFHFSPISQGQVAERARYPTTASGSPEYSGWYFSQKAVTVQACLPVGREGYGALFAVLIQVL